MENDNDGEVPTASVWVWIGLTLISAISFWCQATVTEERFVPALNLLSTEFNIPDDVAGATLMAAGASSPELFSSIVSLFITHSSLGLGTIVGSEIFNQLIICAGAVFAAKSGKLELDKTIVIREVSFYALSIVLLYAALQDKRPVDGDTEEHIFISFPEACMVFAGYIAYVLICANMEAVVTFFGACFIRKPSSVLQASASATDYGSVNYVTQMSLHIDKMPFLQERHNLSHEPAGNFESVQLYGTTSGGEHAQLDTQISSGSALEGDKNGVKSHKSLAGTLRNMIGQHSHGSLRAFDFLMHADKPSDDHDLYSMEINTFEERLSCFMWQRSYFYNKARFAVNGWHLRWFTLASSNMFSVPNRIHFERHKLVYPKFEEIHVDPKRLLIRVIHPHPEGRNFILQCPSNEIFEAVVKKMGDMIDNVLEEQADEQKKGEKEDDDGNGHSVEDHDKHAMESMIEFPADGSAMEIFFFLALYPFRFAMHWTVPDVRIEDEHGNPAGTLGKAWISVIMCLVWLVIGSYAMVASLEALAALMNIPDAVVGVTVSAAGTSLPNYVASKVAAQNGFGNMAVSNAFGSNTFNIMIGLGLPWLLYTSFGTHFEPYSGLRNEGIVESVLIMGSVCALFIILMIPSGFVLYKWHGVVFIVLYILYLVFVIGQVYL